MKILSEIKAKANISETITTTRINFVLLTRTIFFVIVSELWTEQLLLIAKL